MNTLVDSPVSVRVDKDHVLVVLGSNGIIKIPIKRYPRLREATSEQLANIELSPFGLHWPDLDEDLSIRGLLRDHPND